MSDHVGLAKIGVTNRLVCLVKVDILMMNFVVVLSCPKNSTQDGMATHFPIKLPINAVPFHCSNLLKGQCFSWLAFHHLVVPDLKLLAKSFMNKNLGWAQKLNLQLILSRAKKHAHTMYYKKKNIYIYIYVGVYDNECMYMEWKVK